jgi:hypothetical protein
VKIDGSDPRYRDQGGVLFSAHFDSVSTAPGATDDGMGVATLLQLIEYFAENRAKRTAIFNINNGEEDSLNGAHAWVWLPSLKILIGTILQLPSTPLVEDSGFFS